jgi:hypothetical protein
VRAEAPTAHGIAISRRRWSSMVSRAGRLRMVITGTHQAPRESTELHLPVPRPGRPRLTPASHDRILKAPHKKTAPGMSRIRMRDRGPPPSAVVKG